uniref:Frizzled-4 n=1 Tax=Heterorhabditis bacteriophora TaxID=37862 RepID=A0A1I7XQN5_HETBA
MLPDHSVSMIAVRIASIYSLFLVFSAESTSIFDQTSKGKCQPIEIPLCKDIPYNYTYYPNPYLQQDQQSLQTNTEHFKPLIMTKCNKNIQFFVCSVFAPMCPEGMPQAVTSCRSVCAQMIIATKTPLYDADASIPPHRHRQFSSNSCPHDLLDIDPTDSDGACAYKCNADVMFSREDKMAARTWIIVWGSFDFCVSLFTFLTFLIDRKRFRFPERCVFYLSGCFMLYSIPYLFPMFLPYSVRACDRLINGQQYLDLKTPTAYYLLYSRITLDQPAICGGLCLLSHATLFRRYLSAGRKWVPEGIDACSSYVHLVAWGVSAIMTILVLVTHKVDASELSGLCSIGNLDPNSLLFFSLIPRTIIVVVGSCFVVAGFASMCRERDSFRRRGTDTSKLDKLMFKMGLFCLLYIFPSITQIVCDSYHYLTIKNWYPATIGCKRKGGMERGQCHRPLLPQN